MCKTIFSSLSLLAVLCLFFCPLNCPLSANETETTTDILTTNDNSNNGWDEEKLFNELLKDYDAMARPVDNYSETTAVNLRFFMMRLIDLDEKNQVVHIYGWLDYSWLDTKLRWEPIKYGNISAISVPIGKIWRPDVFLYNAVDANFDPGYPTNTIVQHTGHHRGIGRRRLSSVHFRHIRWTTPSIYKSSCLLDITWFPFDEQKCFLEVSTWTYPASQVDLQTPEEGGFDTSQYVVNGEWELSRSYANRHLIHYECCPTEPYAVLKFNLHLRRRTLYYIFNIIIPSLLITAISVLGFILPSDSGDKISIQIAVLLSICFFFSILTGMLPVTSESVPLLGLFFFACMILVSVALLCTVYVLCLHFRTRQMGKTERVLLLRWLPFLLRMHPPEGTGGEVEKEHQEGEGKQRLSAGIATNSAEHCSIPLVLHQIQADVKAIDAQIDGQCDEDQRQQLLNEQWKFAALVVDRLCLWLFSLLICGCIAMLALRAPYIIA